MTPPLNELCMLMYKCAEKLEEEFKTNINEYQNNVISKRITETELAFDKNKDFHYVEILRIIGDIMVNVKKIMYHEDFIRKLKTYGQYEPENKEEVSPFLTLTRSGTAGVVKREKRRIASEVSLRSLEAWESYLKNKDKESQSLEPEGKPDVAKKIHHRYKRRNKKLVSSTYNNILEDNIGLTYGTVPDCNSLIREENEHIEGESDINEKKCYSAEYPVDRCSLSASMFDLLHGQPHPPHIENSRYCSASEEEVELSDTPRIVEVVYKKNPN